MTEANSNLVPALSHLQRRYSLSDRAVDLLGSFAELLIHDELAPTTVREPLRVRDDHLADALVALEVGDTRRANVITDIGSGAGVPGIPLAIALPAARVNLLDSSRRKCDFMSRAVDRLSLDNVNVVHARAETWAGGIGVSDLVTARALAPLDVVLEYSAPLLRVGGVALIWRGSPDEDADDAGRLASELLGLERLDAKQVVPYQGARNRYLYRYIKRTPTPERFPRRDGVARKRPLGSV